MGTWKSLALQASTGPTYDQTRTSLLNRIQAKVVDGKVALGPGLNLFLDVFADTAGIVTPTTVVHQTPNGRIFVAGAEVSGLVPIAMYSINYSTWSVSYVGRISMSTPDVAATTTTFRGLKVLDAGTTGWKIILATSASVVINGGILVANNIALADFIPSGTVIPFATGTDQKAVYFLQDPAFVGVNHIAANLTNNAPTMMMLDRAADILYSGDGAAATPRFFRYNLAASFVYTTAAITGLQATDRINYTGHPFLANDPIVFPALTGGAGLVAGTVYFVVNPTANDFQVSATSGGAAINFTTDISAGTCGRAFGTSTSNFVHRTGVVTPGLIGTILLVDNGDLAEPVAVNPLVDGQKCAFFGTSSNLYMGRLDELTSGTTSWPSLITVNLFGSSNQITAPTALQTTWSDVLQKALYLTNTAIVVGKPFVNNQIDFIFAGIGNKYLELAPSNQVVPMGLITVGAIDMESGVIAFMGTTVGQRGVILCDIYGDAMFDSSVIISKVVTVTPGTLKAIKVLQQRGDDTGTVRAWYRTSGFGSASGGWISIDSFSDLSALAIPGTEIQFKFASRHLNGAGSIPAQIVDAQVEYSGSEDMSENWVLSQANSSNSLPAKVAFRLQYAYGTSVPVMRVIGLDDSGSQIYDKRTDLDAAEFEFSANNGTSWSPLGVIPNTALTTELRLNLSSPAGVPVRWVILEA